MEFVTKVEEKTGLDLWGAITLYLVFFGVLLFLTEISGIVGHDITILGESTMKHVSDIMSEHEASKSLFALSIVALLLGFINSLFIKNTELCFYNKRIVIPTTNFLISLVFVMLAVSTAVAFGVYRLVGLSSVLYNVLFYGFLKNILLSIFLIYPLIVLKINTNINPYFKNISALLSCIIYSLILSQFHKIDIL